MNRLRGRRSASLVTVLLGTFLSSSLAHASLTFPTREAVLLAAPGEPEVAASFPFTNTGESTVTVTEVHSGCGCTVAALEDRVYEPGEGGAITATFTIGDRPRPRPRTWPSRWRR